MLSLPSMKRITFLVVLLLTVSVIVSPVMAVEGTRSGKFLPLQLKATRAAEIKEKIMAWKGKLVHITEAKVTAVCASSNTISKEDKTYVVNVGGNTKYRRRYWGVSNLEEISVNDVVNVWGKWADDGKTIITALMIRNLSVMKRHGTFVGEIVSISGSTFVMKSVNRGDQSVTVGATTKYVNRKEEMIALADLKVGHRIRVKGLWDKSLNTITEVTHVKDYSLPPKAGSTPVISPTPSVTATPTP